jgi:hypothetical protein
MIDIKQTDIAWPTDKDYKFQRPSNYKDVQWIDTENEHFIVWMRIATMPNFRKLWGKIENNLKGDYTL